MSIHTDILGTIGRTPVVRIRRMAPDHVELYAKLEAFNPMGSVKDRMALAIIEDAERRGVLRPGQTVIEATSGNTGIGLAMVCARKGYPLVVVMAENFSIERRRLMRFLGARVVLTPAAEKGSGMLAKAQELAAAHGWFLCRQFDNLANARIHYATTAQEILDDFAEQPLDCFVSGFGTGGTLLGIARRLRADSPGTRIVACEPDNSPLLGSGIAQPRDASGAPTGSHPAFRPHLMQGWSPDFVSGLVERVREQSLIDEIVPVAGADALQTSRALARSEGIFTGISGGATLAAALAVAREAAPGTRILCMLPDTGERYLSTPLFEHIEADMDAEELAISRSTPRCRFDAASVAVPAVVTAAREPVDAGAVRCVDEALSDREQPVVMFALAWCEFCWSVRRLFAHLDVPYRAIELDAVEYQGADLGGRIRSEIRRRTGQPTIPQVFVGGAHIGGCTDVFDAFRDGRLAQLLAAAGITPADGRDLDPESLLPAWVHPRKSA